MRGIRRTLAYRRELSEAEQQLVSDGYTWKFTNYNLRPVGEGLLDGLIGSEVGTSDVACPEHGQKILLRSWYTFGPRGGYKSIRYTCHQCGVLLPREKDF